MYDPNGLQVEFTTRTDRHDHIMAEERATAHRVIREWSANTRQEKEAKLGAEVLERRSRQVDRSPQPCTAPHGNDHGRDRKSCEYGKSEYDSVAVGGCRVMKKKKKKKPH